MSSVDPVATILGGLDRPVQPRLEFAEALLSRLLDELGGAQPPAREPQRLHLRVPRFRPSAPRALRLALIVLVLLLLLATVALATYFGIRTWISASPGGVQYASDFRLGIVFRDPPRAWSRSQFHSSFVLAPSGNDIYNVTYLPPRQIPGPWRERNAELVRLVGVASGRAREERLLAYRHLAQPRLWDTGTDLRHAVISEYRGPQSLALARNGDVFLLAATRPSSKRRSAKAAVSLIVRHADGSLQKVLTVRELMRSGILEAGGTSNGALGVAASAPDRLWLSARQSPGFLLEVIDPNADGNWADRVVHRLRLPPSFPKAATTSGRSWTFHQLLAEPSTATEDRSRSILVTASNSLAIRVYRIADLNGDGDALDKGEVRLLLRTHRQPLFGPTEVTIAARTVVRDGKVVLRELVASGFSRPTRISRISYSGRVTDVGRSFYWLEKVLSGRDGRVYALVQKPDVGLPQTPGSRGPEWIIYRLTPRT